MLIVVLVRQAPDWPLALLGVILAMLLVQTFWLRPALDDRATRIIDGEDMPASSLHLVYIALEGVKLIALPILGTSFAWRWIA